MLFKFVIVGTVCALAAAKASWGVEQNIMGAVGTSVSFVNENRGYYPMDANDGGSTILLTNDGGVNWNSTGPENVAMFLGSDAKGNNVVASTLFGAIYSTDGGQTFNEGNTYNGGQSVKFSDTKVWIPNNNEVQSSADGGATWTTHNIPVLKTDARYVAAPSDNVIYVSAGEWPQQSPQKAAKAIPLSARWTIQPHVTSSQKSAIPTFGKLNDKHATATDQPTTFKMQMVKSTDGGATWTSQFFSDSNNMYFNAVDCYDAEHCCAAAEGTGVAVYCTNDGNTWSQVYSAPSETLSLMAAAYVGPQEIWIGGGNLDQFDMYAYMLHSVDGGKTWTVEGTDVTGQYPNDLSFVSPTRGWASTFNALQQSGLMEFKDWSSSSKSKSFLQ